VFIGNGKLHVSAYSGHHHQVLTVFFVYYIILYIIPIIAILYILYYT